eukprot:GHVT01014483.1.p1 GENE.GHVT01014483.1~~GHVT01014483.1.p1  ORF type:complete len:154 (+),score=0.46 GHVT01014483.1:185-646(+)
MCGSVVIRYVLLMLILHQSSGQDPEENNNEVRLSQFLEKLFARTDRRIRPSVGGPPADVKLGFYVISFGSISEMDMDYTMDIYLRQKWRDTRMSYNISDTGESPITLGANAVDKVWTPDIFFPNEKSASLHMLTKPNKLMRLYENGTVIYSIR